MAAYLLNPSAEVNELARRIGSVEAGATSFIGLLAEELPVLKPVLKMLITVREMFANMKVNKEELAALVDKCVHAAALLVARIREVFASSRGLRQACADDGRAL